MFDLSVVHIEGCIGWGAYRLFWRWRGTPALFVLWRCEAGIRGMGKYAVEVAKVLEGLLEGEGKESAHGESSVGREVGGRV